jgi:AraC family transcriptional regulator
MLQTVEEILAPNCRFEIMEAEWPKPVELPWITTDPTLTTMFSSPSYHMEGRIAGSTQCGFSAMGRTFMLPPDHELIGRGSGGKMRVARCTFDRDLYGTLFSPMPNFSEEELKRMFDIGTTTISLLMKRLVQEAMSPGFASELLVESIATTLLIECGRHIFLKAPIDAAQPRTGLLPRHMRLIEDYLEGVEIGMPRIADLAELCGFSPHYFAKLFRQATGQSLGRYIAEWRLRRAERLLTETSLPLKEIAYRLGFANAANFSTAFSKELHQTPGAFRKLRNLGQTRQELARLH